MKFTCEVCGLEGVRTLRGRPRTMHDECRKLNQLLGWTEDLIAARRFTPDAAKRLRSRLWYLANGLNARLEG